MSNLKNKDVKATEVKLTFKPLSGGRYRCNQTREITKNCKKYSRGNHKIIKKTPELTKIAMVRDNRWLCPECGRTNNDGILLQVNTCSKCSKKVFINKQLNSYSY